MLRAVMLAVVMHAFAFLTPQAVPARDPHRGRFTTGLGRSCAFCHDRNPRAERWYRAAGGMAKMVEGLNRGPLRPYRPVDCWTCHRAGGDRRLLHPPGLDRSAVERIVNNWPGNPQDAENVRRVMGTYAVSLGVGCDYCHVPGNWKAEKRETTATRAMAGLMKEFVRYFDFARASAFTCYTCHQGAVRLPR